MTVDNTVNNLNAAELDTLEWLKQWVLCYEDFIAIWGQGRPRESRCFSAARHDGEGQSAGATPAALQGPRGQMGLQPSAQDRHTQGLPETGPRGLYPHIPTSGFLTMEEVF